jgi:Tol biopolymer transport system component
MTKGDERVRPMFYSPDGHWIYFQPHHQNIYRMPATGGAPQQVTHFSEPTLFIEEPTISPDGRYLYYSGGTEGPRCGYSRSQRKKSESEAEK